MAWPDPTLRAFGRPELGDGDGPRPCPQKGSLAEHYRTAQRARSGGFAFTELVSERLATGVAAAAMRFGAHPSVLTIGNLVLGLGGSAAVFFGARRPPVSAPVVAGAALWQLAYVLDCADGPVARATGKATAVGGRLDKMVDFAVQSSMVVALSRVAEAKSRVPVAAVAAFAGTWYVNFLTDSVMRGAGEAHDELKLVRSRRLPLRLGNLGRDYPFVTLTLGGWAAFAPASLVVPVLACTGLNIAVLLAHIVRDAPASMRASRNTSGTQGATPAVTRKVGR